MSREHTCCVTGHRDIPADKIQPIRDRLHQELLQAIENGYTHFISGFAAGADLLFAELAAELKKTYPITLEAAVPYPGRMETPDKMFQKLIQTCDIIKIHGEKYSKSCYMNRNRYMVDASSLVIAVHDGRKTGGTAATLRYARKTERTIREICFSTADFQPHFSECL